LELDTPVGALPVRIGVSCYEDGSIESTEPQWPLMIPTPIGSIEAYDPDAEGYEGGFNSLNFWPAGSLKSLLSIGSKVSILKNGQVIRVIEPKPVQSHYHDGQALEPFMAYFEGDLVSFGDRYGVAEDSQYNKQDYGFLIETFDTSAFLLGCLGC
jgi:hypothetical protein